MRPPPLLLPAVPSPTPPTMPLRGPPSRPPQVDTSMTHLSLYHYKTQREWGVGWLDVSDGREDRDMLDLI